MYDLFRSWVASPQRAKSKKSKKATSFILVQLGARVKENTTTMINAKLCPISYLQSRSINRFKVYFLILAQKVYPYGR